MSMTEALFIDLHVSATRHALSPFAMPAMSPTMTEGGIASWKRKEGEAYNTGDVLLEIVNDFVTEITKSHIPR
jgi:pyruvate dehydrogenase E2 component (dihydrolipoamide acetyltransferase)